MKKTFNLDFEQNKILSLSKELDNMRNQMADLMTNIKVKRDEIVKVGKQVFNYKISQCEPYSEEYIKLVLPYEEFEFNYEETKRLERDTNGRIRFSGYNSETAQRVLSISIETDDDVILIEGFLNKFIPFIKDDNGIIEISVVDNSLSEFGCIKLFVKKDSYEVTKTTYGRTSVLYTNKSLRQALEYIKKHHKYNF